MSKELKDSWKTTLDQQWFQIALKTYFWAGVLFAVVFAFSISSLFLTMYYADKAELRSKQLQLEYKSYLSDLDKSRKELYEVKEVLRQCRMVWAEIIKEKNESR